MVPSVDVFASQGIAQFLSETIYWIFLALIFASITQRRHRKTAAKKGVATLYLAIAAFLIHTASILILAYNGTDLHMLAVVVVIVGAVVYFRDRTFPFTLRCRVSGKRLDSHTILYRDSNILPEFEESPENENTEHTAGERTDEEIDRDDADSR